MPPLPIQVVFEGDNDRPFAAFGTVGFPVKEDGPYWFAVALDGVVLTYTAIRVVYMRSYPNPQLPPA